MVIYTVIWSNLRVLVVHNCIMTGQRNTIFCMQAAQDGALATTSMEAHAGRASYVHSSQITQPDPGAHAVALWLETIHKQIETCVTVHGK